jgi:hypothetical protein
MRKTILVVTTLGILALLVVPGSAKKSAVARDPTTLTCTSNKERCLATVVGNNIVCNVSFDNCMKSGIWDSTRPWSSAGHRYSNVQRR